MNKQELIKEYESIVKDDSLELCGCYNMADKIFMRKIYKSVLEDLEHLDEPQKVTVLQIVADYIKYAKDCDWDLIDAMKGISYEDYDDLMKWFYKDNNQETFALAWINGYTVEEKRYLVKMKGISVDSDYLNYDSIDDEWYLASDINGCNVRTHHTRKELEEAGFGLVFDCPLFEVEEVKE